jgi:hypothetical protein
MPKGVVLNPRRYNTSVTPPLVLEDTSRYKNNGTFGAGATAPTWVRLSTGVWVLNFVAASNQTVTHGNNVSLFPSAMTYKIWFNQLVFGNSQRWYGHWKTLFFSTGNNQIPIYTLYFSDGTDTGVVNCLAAYKLAVWHLLTLSWNSSTSNIIITLDNIVIRNTTYAGKQLNTPTFSFGYGNMPGFASFYNGLIALPQIFNYVLSASEVWSTWQSERRWFGV